MSYHQHPDLTMVHQAQDPSPMSRTHQYRKVMKPLLERKRRARINKCLDEIKDILVESMQMEGESVTKLEKADVLELTLKHLQKLKAQQRLVPAKRSGVDIAKNFSHGYKACVNQVSQFLQANSTTPQTHHFGASLMHHLGDNLKSLEMRNTSESVSQPLTVIVPQHRLSASPNGQTLLRPAATEVVRPSIQSPHSTISSSDCGYSSGRDSVSPCSTETNYPQTESDLPLDLATKSVWRPF